MKYNHVKLIREYWSLAYGRAVMIMVAELVGVGKVIYQILSMSKNRCLEYLNTPELTITIHHFMAWVKTLSKPN